MVQGNHQVSGGLINLFHSSDFINTFKNQLYYLPPCSLGNVKARLTQAIFVAQLNAVFVALKLQLQNRAYTETSCDRQFIADV